MKQFNIIFILILFSLLINIKAEAIGYGVGKIENNSRPNLDIKDITENNGYTIGEDDNRIYLTFDCGYENGYTNSILDTLNEYNVKAAFFITGHYLKTSKDIVKRMIDEGHLVCNHTMYHKSFEKISSDEMLEDIRSLENLYYETFNLNLTKYVRPPRGEYTKTNMEVLASEGYKTIFWSLAYVDWYKDRYNGSNYSYNQVMDKIHNGAIILMHTVSKDNMIDLGKIITKLNENYIFSSLEEL